MPPLCNSNLPEQSPPWRVHGGGRIASTTPQHPSTQPLTSPTEAGKVTGSLQDDTNVTFLMGLPPVRVPNVPGWQGQTSEGQAKELGGSQLTASCPAAGSALVSVQAPARLSHAQCQH